MRATVAAAGEVTLRELLDLANPRLGPFSVATNELGGPLRAHLREMVARGEAVELPGRSPATWRALS